MTMNQYEKNYVEKIKSAKTQKQLYAIINRIYEDGFEDGYNEEKNDTRRG